MASNLPAADAQLGDAYGNRRPGQLALTEELVSADRRKRIHERGDVGRTGGHDREASE